MKESILGKNKTKKKQANRLKTGEVSETRFSTSVLCNTAIHIYVTKVNPDMGWPVVDHS